MQITITIIRSASRRFSTTMRIVNRGEVELRAPQRMPVERIFDFVSANTKFLAKSLHIPHQQKVPKNITTGTDLFIFGEKYLVEVQPKSRSQAVVDVRNKAILIKYKASAIPSKKLYDLLAPTLGDYILPRAKELAVKMSEKRYKTIRFKLVRSLWGSCTRTGNITFNKKLIHYPKTIIDYVIVHELAHLQQPNHSQSFWDIVTKFYPDAKKARKILRSRIYS